MLRARLRLAIFAVAVLGGCQTIEYGPIDGKITPVYGYQETQTREGAYILMMRALGGGPESVHYMWDRRARELCGPEYQKLLYRAERPTTTYGYYGGAPGNMILEGFLQCGSGPMDGTVTPASAPTPAPTPTQASGQ
jgi:hypothetical protein